MRKKKPLVSPEIALKTCGYIKNLMVSNHGLSRWELDFLGWMRYNERFSIKQAAIIARMHKTVAKLGFFVELP